MARTGTSFLAKILQSTLPGKPNLYVEPKSDSFFNDLSQWKSGSHIVKIIFEHWNNQSNARESWLAHPESLGVDHIFCLIRDPRDMALSRLLYFAFARKLYVGISKDQEREWVKILQQKEQNPASLSFLDLARKLGIIMGIDYYKDVVDRKYGFSAYSDFLKQNSEHFSLVRYEELVSGNFDALEQVLNCPVRIPMSMEELEYTKRSGGSNGWKQFFTLSDLAWFKERFGSEMEWWGYCDWELMPSNSLSSVHISNYVKLRFSEAEGDHPSQIENKHF